MVSNITVSGSRIPLAFSGFRIAHVSDLHNAQFGENNEILLRELSQITPDIIVITGDLVDAQHTDIGVLYTGGSTNMVVSCGLGNSIPVRFNNRPEIGKSRPSITFYNRAEEGAGIF